MKIGVALPNCREGLMYPTAFATTDSIVKMAQEAEELEFESVWVNDHITTQRYLKKLILKPNFFEPLVTLSYLAASTKLVRLCTGIVVVPLRNPVILAKQVATLDVMSNGRLILGVGIGAYREEFEAIHGPSGNRGNILEETVKALRDLLTKPSASFHGKYVKFTEIELNPKPIQKPLPMWMGGNAPAVLKRVGELGNGWIPAILSPAEIEKSRERIYEYAEKAGRDPSKIEIAPEFILSIADDKEEARKSFRRSPAFKHLQSLKKSTLKNLESVEETELEKRNFIGTPDEIIRKLEDYEEAGVTHIWFDFIGDTASKAIKGMRLFAHEVKSTFET